MPEKDVRDEAKKMVGLAMNFYRAAEDLAKAGDASKAHKKKTSQMKDIAKKFHDDLKDIAFSSEA